MTRRRQVVHSINFSIIPWVDTVLRLEGQRFVVVGSMLHRREDGERVPLIRWRSHCPTCGEVFECATSLKAKYPNRRCEKHHRPGLAVTERGKISRRFYRSANRHRNSTG